MLRPASISPAVLVEYVVPPSLKADVLAMVMGAAWAVATDGRHGVRETAAARATVTAGPETASARKTEAERFLCAGVCSGGVERSCSRRIAKGWRPPSPIPVTDYMWAQVIVRGRRMSGSMRRILNLGLLEGVKRAYSLRRLNLELSKVKFFHPTAQEAAAHGKVLPTLTPAQAEATSRTRICNTDLATAEAAAPKIDPPKTELVIKPPEVSYSIRSPRCVHFLPTASESKVVMVDRGNRMIRFNIVNSPHYNDTQDGQVPRHSRYIDSMPSLHGYKEAPLTISVPPTNLHLLDGEDAGDLYIIDSVLHPNKADVRPQFEALVWRGITTSLASHRFWHCDILPLPPWITHHRNAFVYGHALVGDTICFSISGPEGNGTYCFHMATRQWSKAGDWLMPFHGKADYVPELGLWFGVADGLPCAADLSGVVGGEEPPPEKMRIWVHDDLPEEWQPNQFFKPRVISLGSGKFMVVDFLDDMQFDKESNEMCLEKQFALFTGMEVAYSNGNGKGKNSRNGAIKDNDHSSGSENGGKGKGKGLIRGLRMIKHKSGRYMFNNHQRIEEVL
ncbi:uncharacterized protein LOC119357000 [Triticum dicoccoides]|uniref:uncharacterized protein LOC119357000 n=1 Tax=Triticum dicoccoides TaxID=85692 RepID=UPI00188E93E6|nr:uncharacterized protein LOC119357000 [Triticum dicoccoides]